MAYYLVITNAGMTIVDDEGLANLKKIFPEIIVENSTEDPGENVPITNLEDIECDCPYCEAARASRQSDQQSFSN